MVGYFLKQLDPILDLSKNANTITFESKNNNSENIMWWLRGWDKFLNRWLRGSMVLGFIKPIDFFLKF